MERFGFDKAVENPSPVEAVGARARAAILPAGCDVREADLRADLRRWDRCDPGAWRAVSYLSAFDPAHGPESLLKQMRATDAASATMPSVLLKRFVDSGSEIGPQGIGRALEQLEAGAEAGAFDVVFVEHISRFAADYATALRFALDLTRTGIRIVEACGGPIHSTLVEAVLFSGKPS